MESINSNNRSMETDRLDSYLIPPSFDFFTILLILTLLGGIGFVMPIGGGDMPVVISLLNSFSGIAAAFAGLLLTNNVLIVAGSLVGASGLILTIIMAKAMNRSIGNILFVGYASSSSNSKSEEVGEVKPINVSDAYLILENASSVLVIPGYGMAVAQAQHVVRELGELLAMRLKHYHLQMYIEGDLEAYKNPIGIIHNERLIEA